MMEVVVKVDHSNMGSLNIFQHKPHADGTTIYTWEWSVYGKCPIRGTVYQSDAAETLDLVAVIAAEVALILNQGQPKEADG